MRLRRRVTGNLLPFVVMTLATLLLIPLPASLVSCSSGNETVVSRQEVAVAIIPERHLLQGTSTLTVIVGGDTLRLLISPSAVIEEVTVAGNPAHFSFSRGILAIPLHNGSEKGLIVLVRYHAAFDQRPPDRPVNDEDPTFGITGAISDRGTFLGSDAAWYPLPPVTPRQRVTTIHTPAGVEAITAGKREGHGTVSGRTTSTWVESHPVGALSLAAGPFRIAERHVDGIDLYTYLSPDNADLSSRYLDAAARYIRFYAERFGPYPFEKFAVVENFFPTGYGFPSYTLLGGGIIRLPFIIDTSLPHEIAHNWWGNGVLVGEGGNWCEGLVTYLADYLLKERTSPEEARQARFQMLADYATLVPAGKDFPLEQFSGRVDPASRAIGYGKGAMLFHMVRRAIGDDAFFAALRGIVRERCYRTATWQDFVRAFSQRAGRDLAPFFTQWLTRPGGPHLNMEQVVRQRVGKRWQVSGTLVQPPPLYAVTVPLSLQTAGGEHRQRIAVSGERTPFRFTVDSTPRRLGMDPESDLFRILSADEIPPSVNTIKGSRTLLAVRTGECRADPETLRLLLQSFGQNDIPIVDEAALGSFDWRQRDLLFCGPPRSGTMQPLQDISPHADRFSVDGSEYHDPDDLLFLVSNRADGALAALFLPLSEQSAREYVRKITHYGRYGLLVFSGGRNRHKGILPSLSAGTTVEFAP